MTTSPRRPRTSPRRTVVAARPAVSRGRVVCAAIVMTVVTVGFGWRLVDLQLRPDPALAGQIGSQVREQVIEAPRGNIVDRHGRAMALSLTRPSIIADPRLVPAAAVDGIVAQLAELLSTDPGVMARRLRSDQAFVYLERQVEPAVGEAVLALGLPGISSQDEPYRDHPNRECSGLSVIGRVDIDQIGISGLEEAYDDHLTGEPGLVVRETQRGGDVRIPGGYQVVTPVEPGLDLHLTLDRNIQYEAEQLLVTALEETGGGKATAVVTDPVTGEIYAMANAVRDVDTGRARCTTTNLAATWTYEPGSIMKALTFAAVFEHDAWDEHTPIHIPSVITVQREAGVADHRYTDVNLTGGDATHPPSWILAKSSNNGTIRLASQLGPDGLQATLEDLGLGRPTALGFKGEASGILDDLDSHSLMLSNVAIGQSAAVTPLQMIQAYNTIANRGLQVDPVLVADQVGVSEAGRVLRPDTAEAVLRLMRGVVSDEGTGRRAQIPGYVVAGKTGTAWQPCSPEFGYWCDDGVSRHYSASFAGIVENDRGPALSVLVVIDDPQGANFHGGTIAAPVFADLASYALRQLRIPPAAAGTPIEERVRAVAAAPAPEETAGAGDSDPERGDEGV